MKKILAVVVTVCILCSFSIPALAADSEVFEYTWSERKPAVEKSGISGRFVAFEQVDLSLWLPDTYKDYLEDEDREEGYVALYMTDDMEDAVFATYSESGYQSSEDYLKDLISEGFSDAELVSINGIEAVEYTLKDEETEEVYWCIDFITESGNLLEICIFPITEDDIPVLTYIESSIMSAEDAKAAA